MIAAAQRRAERDGSFICADAESHVFEPASFDTIVSRFGVMFFDDPVRAFSNLRRAARLGPLGRALVDADEGTKNRVLETVRVAFDPYVHGTEVRFDAACWSVGAV